MANAKITNHIPVCKDNGDGTISVQIGPNGYTWKLTDIDAILAAQPDPSAAQQFNFAFRLAQSGYTTCQSSPGVADTTALAVINAASFVGYA